MDKPEQCIKNILFFNEIKFDYCKFQRMVQWDDELYNDFIDSIFNNIPTGQIILNYISNKNLYEIIDGQHRINIICDFINNKKKYNNNYYSDLSIIDNKHFISTNLFTVIYKDLDDDKIMRLYLTINSGIDQDENHITKLLVNKETNKVNGETNKVNGETNKVNGETNKVNYSELLKYYEEKYNDINTIQLLKIINIISYIVFDYDENGINGVRFKQLSKAHFKIITEKIRKKYEDERTQKNIIIITKILDIIYSLIKNKPTYSNNIYTFITHKLYIDLYPEFNYKQNNDLIKFIDLVSCKNNLSLNELFTEYDKEIK
jgi:hypothetical protein